MIDASTLNTGADLGSFDTAMLAEAWRQAHFAAQAAAEVGKSWGLEQPDDSHSSMVWVRAGSWRGLEGVPATGDKEYRARLGLETLELSLVDGRGGTIDQLPLPGRTLAEATGWIGATCERELGPRRQPSRPAPDLPEHPIADGAEFAAPGHGHLQLAQLYAGTVDIVARLRESAPAFGAPSCWPHHFDLASLAVVATDDAGAMTRTIGVGITPPDTVEPAGYWYVSPWTKHGADGTPDFPALSFGHWFDRGGLPMAVLPVSELSQAPDRPAALGAFVAEAVNTCMSALDG
ncbi:MAG: hypothetical protein ACYTGC_03450 [Planctomycetota bacterium]|jgi:hypothetical protein